MGKKLTNEEFQEKLNQYFVEDISLIGDYNGKRSIVKLRCNNCGYEWETAASNAMYLSKTKSHRCPNCFKHGANGEKLKCAYCGKEIYRTRYQIDKNQSGYFYCSKQCGNLHKNELRRQSGEWKNSVNYRLKAFNEYEHKCLCCGWNEDERILEVHHIDENHSNNTIDNLCILCPTCHRKITLGYYKLDLINKLLIKQ